MNPHEHAPRLAARHLDSIAHRVRNELGTIASCATLIDDTEIADALNSARGALQRQIEIGITLARIELDAHPADVTVSLADLLEQASRRARREGFAGTLPMFKDHAVERVEIHGPGLWLERLVTELVHASSLHAFDVDITHGFARFDLPIDTDAAHVELFVETITRLAGACGGSLDRDALRDAHVRIALPTAD